MSAGRCPIAGCNYPEGGCSGACLDLVRPLLMHEDIEAQRREALQLFKDWARQANADLDAAHQVLDAAHQVQRVEDSLSAASWCALGLLAICLVALASALGMAVADALIH